MTYRFSRVRGEAESAMQRGGDGDFRCDTGALIRTRFRPDFPLVGLPHWPKLIHRDCGRTDLSGTCLLSGWRENRHPTHQLSHLISLYVSILIRGSEGGLNGFSARVTANISRVGWLFRCLDTGGELREGFHERGERGSSRPGTRNAREPVRDSHKVECRRGQHMT